MITSLNSIFIFYLLRTRRLGSSSSMVPVMTVSTIFCLLQIHLLHQLPLVNKLLFHSGTIDWDTPHCIWFLTYCTPTIYLIFPLPLFLVVPIVPLLSLSNYIFLQAQLVVQIPFNYFGPMHGVQLPLYE